MDLSRYELTPVAIAAGRRLSDRLFGGEPEAMIEYHLRQIIIATVFFGNCKRTGIYHTILNIPDTWSLSRYADIATVVFSPPPIGTIGLTEPQAREEYGGVRCYESVFKPMQYRPNCSSARVLVLNRDQG